MKKVVYECVGNSILFILSAMMLINPFASFSNDANGFEVTFGIFPVVFIIYLVAFIIVRGFVFKDSKKPLFSDSELAYQDEREKIIVAEATKAAYKVLVFSLIVSMAILAAIRAFSLTVLSSWNINLYAVSVALISIILVLAMISYCTKWCIEYKK